MRVANELGLQESPQPQANPPIKTLTKLTSDNTLAIDILLVTVALNIKLNHSFVCNFLKN